jgi:aminocarboxymuconate-semialdehyde decarboxylase
MRTIDLHCHVTPQCFQKEVLNGRTFHGLNADYGELNNPRNAWTPQQRLLDMDSMGIDVQIVSPNVSFYMYDADVATTTAIDRDCNNEIGQMIKDAPTRFSGLGNLPMQDIPAAISEMERCMKKLNFKGVQINDHINGKNFDDPIFFPFWKAAEQMGAMILIHQAGDTTVSARTRRYHLPNSIGNLTDRTVTFASFVFGGVMDKFPNLRVCLAHGGGYTCFGIGRIDRGWQVKKEARVNITRPPSTYLSAFYYDCITHSEPALRMLIDSVGIDRVILGTDYPADMCIDWPSSWVQSLKSLTLKEKEAILYKNLEKLLGL